MFLNLPKPPVADRVPWDTPLRQRIDEVLTRRCRVAWLYLNPDTSTFRYRVFNMVEGLNRDPQGRASATWFSGDELDHIHHLIPLLHAIVITRFQYGAALDRVIRVAQRVGTRVVFDSDDLVFDVRYAPLVMDSLALDTESHAVWDAWYSYMGRLAATASRAHAGITTNSFLAARMSAAFDRMPTSVVPNFLNRDQQAFSRQLFEAKRSSGWRRDRNVTIGYFSGSPTHRKDFAVAAPALARLLDRDAAVTVRIAGYLDEAGALSRHKGRVEILPHMNYIALQRSIAEVEINIAPLQDNAFTNCKSELKFFEAAAVGTWTVATPTSTFAAAIVPGETGALARAHEWDDALQEAVELARDTKRYAAFSDAAAEHVHIRYGWDQFAEQILRAVDAPNELTQ
jgi:glycosyltransferase involved in cell wall biosynthesis